jgi:hypothetical protein
MAYEISGLMVTACECTGALCPCNVDQVPNTPNNECQGVIALGVKSGNLDDLDLSGANAALLYTIPGKPSDGGWRIGLVVDENASDDQADALERIFSGKEGGMWEEFSGLFGGWLGMERAPVSVSNGGSPSGSVGGMGEVALEPFKDGEGNATRVKNALFGMGPEFTIGQASGSIDGMGIKFGASYGDTHEFDWAG